MSLVVQKKTFALIQHYNKNKNYMNDIKIVARHYHDMISINIGVNLY